MQEENLCDPKFKVGDRFFYIIKEHILSERSGGYRVVEGKVAEVSLKRVALKAGKWNLMRVDCYYRTSKKQLIPESQMYETFNDAYRVAHKLASNS